MGNKYLNKFKFIFVFVFLFMFLCAPMMQTIAYASGRCADLFSEVSHESKVQAKREQVRAKSKRVLTQNEHQIESEQVPTKSKRRTENEQTDVDGTKGLIAYLGLLLERQIIGDKELLRLIEGLERDEIPNPIHEEDTWVSSAALIHREEIENYIHKTQINSKELLKWSRKSLKEKERVRVKREETREETQDVYQKIELHPVKAGRFRMGDREKDKVEVNLTNPIEVMSTPSDSKTVG